MRPDLNRVPGFYHRYIQQVPENDLMEAFKIQSAATIAFLESIPASKHSHRYAEGKWSVKEVLQHIIDAERVFSYRAMCFARQDKTSLPSFDENLYADTCKADRREWQSLFEEFKTVRKASEYLFASFDAEQLDTTGTANSNPVYVLGVGYITIGHALHHVQVLRERYL